MIKRPFFALVGLGIGVTLGIWTARRLDEARQALAPGQVASRAGARAGALGERLAAAIAAGRDAAALKESELREAYGVAPASAVVPTEAVRPRPDGQPPLR